jgi:hypothetical protein
LESAQPVNATTSAQAASHPSRGLDDRTRNAVDSKTDMALDVKTGLASLVQAWLVIIIVQKARNPAETACTSPIHDRDSFGWLKLKLQTRVLSNKLRIIYENQTHVDRC